MQETRNIVLFDGVCNLCNRAVRFILKRDTEGLFQFASMQSEIAKTLIAEYHTKPFRFDSILLIQNSTCYDQSDAVMEIARVLPGCRIIFGLLKATPKPIRDFFYRIIARHRYRIFGKRKECMIPTQEIRNRFINS